MPNYRELLTQERPEMQARVEKRIEQARGHKKTVEHLCCNSLCQIVTCFTF
ncbi:hypothetical protein LGZ99_11850 [Photorhabdus temperata]|uniref:Uncharacterized protein n=1 Tax=Photorhabdus temperata subsp. temperata Meg1 TaxID=1393735 RepID=A0A081RWS5_PHOTE|nr:hypothetical protein [Photorhabdus temperata]KER03128.1 hypothetical protein MEG1DRAFT_02264 [Photorhabdus temperata subsp. temperata Meg1]MCT8347879.1 hypothetical protein [Photorhabdus temperata]